MKTEEDPPDLSEANARAKRVILPYMRHELRTPINAIIGYSEMLLEDIAKRGEGAKDLRSDLANICLTGRQLLALVNDTKADVDLETFGTNFRHAIRTMINTVLGYTEMMLEDTTERDGDDFAGDLTKIQSAGKQLFTLIEQFVKFGQIESGQTSIDLETAGISPMIHDVVTAIRPLAQDGENLEPLQGHLLVVDDNEMNRDLLTRYLKRHGYTVDTADNGRRALEVIARQQFDLVLLDMMMPEMNGYQVLQTLKTDTVWHNIPVIMLSALDEIDGVVRCLEIGAEDYLSKPFDSALLRVRIESSLEKKRLRDKEEIYRQQIEEANRQLESRVEEQLHQLQDSYDRLQESLNGSVLALSSAVERRDPYTAGHQQRVSRLACATAKEMGLPENQVEGVRVAGILHDIGKISVPAEILCKPGRLSASEFGVIKDHPGTGFDILKNVSFPWPIAQIVKQHQERFDGSGYPSQLSGEDILIEARIIGVADVVEAMASHRPYRAALGMDQALDEIATNKGSFYDAWVVDACLKLFTEKLFKLDE